MMTSQAAGSLHVGNDQEPHHAPATINLNGVSKQFRLGRSKSVQALAPVDLRLEDGGFVALFGPSGCGKSTLLRLIAGLETPTTGDLQVGGLKPAQLLAEHRLGYVFQDHALLPWLTVQANIALPFKIAKQPVDQGRVTDLISLIGLEGFEDARPRHLSGGMRQRVSVARALALSPDLLLLDEPFGALDEITRRRLNFELARIWQDTGVTTVLVTHSAAEAVLLSDTAHIMAAQPGRIATTIDIPLSRPRTAETLTDPEFARLETLLIKSLDDSEDDPS